MQGDSFDQVGCCTSWCTTKESLVLLAKMRRNCTNQMRFSCASSSSAEYVVSALDRFHDARLVLGQVDGMIHGHLHAVAHQITGVEKGKLASLGKLDHVDCVGHVEDSEQHLVG